jgi:integrase/recombinase XerD
VVNFDTFHSDGDVAMIRVQQAWIPGNTQVSWLVIGADYLPVEPIQGYLKYLENLERVPNTIRSYANHLKLFWEFLEDHRLNWCEICLEDLSDFIHWLRNPKLETILIQPQIAVRTERTVNTILSAVCSFYQFHELNGTVRNLNLYRYQYQQRARYKSFLHHINKGRQVKTRLLKVKEPRKFVGCLKVEEVKQIVYACNCLRDKFLICLLYETGLRIGEALGLRHEDIHSIRENLVKVVPRNNNLNGARAKSASERHVDVSGELMELYSNYLINEYPEEIDSEYVFVNIWKGRHGYPMTYSAVDSLFKRLRKKTGIRIHPHLFRHTHATELVKENWDMAHIQKRLGHSDIQTTINIYTHLTHEDLKRYK